MTIRLTVTGQGRSGIRKVFKHYRKTRAIGRLFDRMSFFSEQWAKIVAVLALSLAALALVRKPSPTKSPSRFAAADPVPAPLSVGDWYIDGLSLGAPCSDDSQGLSSASPVCRLTSITSQWDTNDPHLAQLVRIHVISALLTDPFVVNPTLLYDHGSLLIQGTIQQVATATIGTFTPQNRTLHVTNKITASGQSGAYWAPYVGAFVNDTTAGAWFWIEKDLGSAQAQITTPFTQATATSLVPWVSITYVTIANGDSLVLYSLPNVNCKNIGVSDVYSGINNKAAVNRIRCAPTGGNDVIRNMIVSESRISSSPVMDMNEATYVGNNFFDGPTNINAQVVGGAFVGNYHPCFSNASQRPAIEPSLDGDVLLDFGLSFHYAGVLTMGRVYFGPGVVTDPDLERPSVIQIGTYDTPGWYFADSELWGPGSVELHDRSTLVCQLNCTAQLLLTGSLTTHTSTTGYPWLAASNAWGPAVGINPAEIDDAGTIGDPATGDFFQKHP